MQTRRLAQVEARWRDWRVAHGYPAVRECWCENDSCHVCQKEITLAQKRATFVPYACRVPRRFADLSDALAALSYSSSWSLLRAASLYAPAR